MPIYEYECIKCGHQTQSLQKISDPPIEVCDVCRGKMRKLISQSTFHLKGTGWYVTDYASKGQKSQSSGNNSQEKKAGGTDSKKASDGPKKSDSASTSSTTKASEKKSE